MSVVRRIVQLMSIAGSFFSGLLMDFVTGKVGSLGAPSGRRLWAPRSQG